jgi:hypothetical protein
MAAIVINRVKNRIRIPANAMRERSRVQRLVSRAFDGLERTLEQAGLSPRGHLCICELHTVVRIRLHEPDSILTAKLGHAIAVAIDAASRGDSNSAVYYSSRVHALIDLVSSAMRADFTRSWAWQQLELWREGAERNATATADQVMRAIINEPHHATAVLSHVAHDHFILLEMLKWTPPAAWIALSRTVLRDPGAPLDPIEPVSDSRQSILEPIATRILRQSAIATAIAAVEIHDLPPTTMRALSVLVLLEVEPAIARIGGEPARALTSILETLLIRAIAREPLALPRSDNAGTHELAPSEQAQSSNAAVQIPRNDLLSIEVAQTDRPLEDIRRSATTSAGGLLYLINLCRRIGLPDLILGDPRLAHRGLRWSLHQLATSLLSLDDHDPAALAFAGLLPDSPPPNFDQPPPNADEFAALDEFRASLTDRLRGVLAGLLDLSDSALIDFVCRRRAQMFADPGWIEIHFSLDFVSTEIRRAALDLDPGWVPWLGVVVRFVYA